MDFLTEQYIHSVQEPYLSEIQRYWLIKSYNDFPPKFSPNEWKKVCRITNCMAYALNLNRQPQCIFEYIPYYPTYSCPNDITKYITDFLNKLGIPHTQISQPVDSTEKHYTIAIFYSSIEKDVHLIRQDENNLWSHKMGWYSPPEQLGNNFTKIIAEFEKDTYVFCSFLAIHKPKEKK